MAPCGQGTGVTQGAACTSLPTCLHCHFQYQITTCSANFLLGTLGKWHLFQESQLNIVSGLHLTPKSSLVEGGGDENQ